MTLNDVSQPLGLAQGPGLSPTKFNISVDPILWELQAAGAGIRGEHTILGFAWSDDITLLVERHILPLILHVAETAASKVGKSWKHTKSWYLNLSRTWRGRDNATHDLWMTKAEVEKQASLRKWQRTNRT